MAAESVVRVVFLGESASAVRAGSKVEASMLGIGKAALKMSAALGVTVGVVEVFKKIISSTIAFQKALADLNQVAELTKSQLDDVGKILLNVAKKTAQDPSSLAESMKILVAAGFGVQHSLNAMVAIGQAATATQQDLADITKTVSNVLKLYGQDASHARDVTDVLTNAVEHGNLSFADLQSSLTQVLPVAVALKLPFSDLAGTIEQLGKLGIVGGRSMMALRMILGAMLKPNTDLRLAFAQLGLIQVKAAKGSKDYEKQLKTASIAGVEAALKTKGLAAVLGDLANLAQGHPDLIAKWFPARSSAIVFALTGHLKEYRQTIEQSRQSTERAGATNDAFQRRLHTLSGQWQELKTKVTVAAIQIGTVLVPAVTAALTVINRLVGVISRLVGDLLHLHASFRLLAVLLSGSFIPFVIAAEVAGSALSGVFRTLSNTAKTVASAISGALASAFRAVMGPINAVVNAIKTLVHWLNSIPHDISIHIHVPGGIIGKVKGGIGAVGGAIGGVLPATGGIIPMVPGSSANADSVPALLTPGEMVLNMAQQQQLGGQAALAQMFNFAPMARFATGGIAGAHRGGSKSPHAKRGSRRHIRALGAITAPLINIDQREEDLDRGYGQLVTLYDIDGNPLDTQAEIGQRLGEIDSLILERNKMLALLALERKRLLTAIAALKKALVQIRARLRIEQHKKKPNSTAISNYQSMIGNYGSALKDAQHNLGHVLPFDVRDVQLDVLTLQQERKDVSGTVLTPPVAPPDVEALLRQIGQLKLALGIQSAQLGIIGSFAKGTLSVPQTGLALVHSGEQIVPAGQVRGGGDGGSIGDVHLTLVFSDKSAELVELVDARVDAGADRVFLKMGTSASARVRSGRY